MKRAQSFALSLLFLIGFNVPAKAAGLEPLHYNNPGLTVDLGVGLWAWPLPMDFNGDGKSDLVVVCPDKPQSGTFFFENAGADPFWPVFKPGVRVSKAAQNVQVSYIDGKPRVTSVGTEYPDFLSTGLDKGVKLPIANNFHSGRIRANQWRYVDFDGDGKVDLVVGIGDWADYGWDNAFDAEGRWTHGPLHGYIYLFRNTGTNEKPVYAQPVKLEAGGKVIDGFGMPSPCFADFDGDGDLDLICGEFLDGFTYYENIGTRTQPKYAAGRRLTFQGQPVKMDLEMITPVAFDWNHDGRMDLICGDEDGRVAWIENTGKIVDGLPQFLPPRYFQQQSAEVKFGALATPVGFDWDGDGKEDILCGDSAGYIGFIKNLDGGNPPKWAAPKLLEAGGKMIRLQAGPNGSIQGPAEAKWGYTTLCVADWDGDGLPDLIVNSIWGRVQWYRNIGTRTAPKLAAAQSIEVEWEGKTPKPEWVWWQPQGKELVTEWRTTPMVVDWNGDGLNDLVMLDHEGYLALFERVKRDDQLKLLPPKRIFHGDNGSVYDAGHSLKNKEPGLLRLNGGSAGQSGRRKLCLVDWDGDGKLDLLVNSRNVNWLKNVSTKSGEVVFHDNGPLDSLVLAGHDTSPTVVHWNKDGIPDLLVGAEDGHLYFLKNPRH